MHKIVEMIKSRKWWIALAALVLFIIFYCIMAAINISYRNDFEAIGEQVAVEIEAYVFEKYGDLSKKRNGWNFVKSLPDNGGASLLNWEDEDYLALDAEAKLIHLTDDGIIDYYNSLTKIHDFDVICPEWFYPFDIEGYDELLLDEFGLGLMRIKSAVKAVILVADLHFEAGNSEKAFSALQTGLAFVDKLPTMELMHSMIRLASNTMLLECISKHLDEFTTSQLAYLETAIGAACLLDPDDYYTFWLFNAYMYYAIEYDPDVLAVQSKYIKLSNRIAAAVLSPLFLANRMNYYSVADRMKGYARIKAHVNEGRYEEVLEDLQKMFDDPDMKGFGHVAFNIALPAIIKTYPCKFESEVVVLLHLLNVKARLFKAEQGAYPEKIGDIISDGEYKDIHLNENGVELIYRGYTVKQFAKDEVSPETGLNMYALSVTYGITGESIFITKDQKEIYTTDLGEDMETLEWPTDLDEDHWQVVR